jgi:hypothetical protein
MRGSGRAPAPANGLPITQEGHVLTRTTGLERVLLILACLLVLTATLVICAAHPDAAHAAGTWKTYTIRAGEHYNSGTNFSVCAGKRTLRFRVRFSPTCIYDLGNNNQWDINKLYGLSQGYHQTDSARFGWRWLLAEQKIEVLSYCYVGGVRRPAQRICLLDPGQVAAFKLTVQDTVYTFQYLSTTGKLLAEVREPRKHAGLESTNYKLFPYFGGDEVAPHTMDIAIQEY